MSSAFRKSALVSPVVLGITLLFSTVVMAVPKSNEIDRSVSATSTPKDSISNKVSGVSSAASELTPAAQLEADSFDVASEIVKPSHWSYKALQDVATKYDCNLNLNNKPVSQLDLARGLNTCLNKVEPMLAKQAGSVTREDLEVLKRLTQEYRAQLTEIDGRLANTDKKVAQLQANQFSTTTKLKGEAVFNVASTFSGANATNPIFANRVRLLFESSFTGKDKLWTRLSIGNQPSLGSTFNSPSSVGAQVVETGSNNTAALDWLAYQLPVNNANVYVAAFGAIQGDYAPTYGSNFEDFTGASGAIGAFAESSPIYKIGGGSGVGASIPVADTGLTSVNVGYFAFNANNPTTGAGLFGSDNSILGQLNFKISPQLEAGLTYINSSHTGTIYNGTGVVVGSPLANSTAVGRTNADSFGAQFVYKASDKLAFNGFAMTTNARRSATGTTDNIWSYGAGISFPDVDGKGSLAGLFVGAEPYVGGVGSVPLHFEGFYKYKLSDNLSITPGFIYVTNPDQSNGNNALIGVVRTTFLF